ncbi:MAG: alpha/beta hydrolase, partial [Gammaproteobacteria bacterium]
MVLVHGLLLPAASLGLLARRLRAAGWRTRLFAYASTREEAEAAGRRLARELEGLGGRVHLVAHSLGGLVAERALAHLPGPPRGRVLALGTPFRGSQAARRLLARPWGRRLLGVNGPLLAAGIPCWHGPWPLDVLAGTRPIGWGRLLAGPLEGPHDGSVRLAETRVPGLASHTVLRVSHMEMLWSGAVARWALG